MIETHTAMRFAWLRKNSTDSTAIKQQMTNPLAIIRTAYNLVFWVFLLPFLTSVEYSTGFFVFAIIILVRLVANLYSNNVFSQPRQYEQFPFRIP